MSSPYALNFNELGQAFTDNAQLALARNKLDNESSRLRMDEDLHPLKRDLLAQQVDAGQAANDAAVKQYFGGIAQGIQEVGKTDPQRADATWRALHNDPRYKAAFQKSPFGYSPDDWQGGSSMLAREAAGYVDPGKEESEKTKNTLNKAHAGYFDAASKALGVRADATTENAATRRFRAYTDYLDRFSDGIPAKEQWDAMNAPGGLHLTTFGRAIPYADAPRLLSEVRSRVAAGPEALEFEPTAHEAAMGITKEDKIRAIKQRTINDMYGVKDSDMLKKGVRLKPSGDFEPIPGASTQGERQGEVIARQGLKMLLRGETALKNAGPLDQIAGDQWRIPFTDISVGGWGETGEGFQSIKAAILDLNFALSGKSVSNAERKAFLDLYMPTSLDSRRRQAFKIGQIRSYFEEVMRMRHGGANDDDVAEFYRSKINEAEKNATTGQEPKANRGRLPNSDTGWSIRKLD